MKNKINTKTILMTSLIIAMIVPLSMIPEADAKNRLQISLHQI